MAYKIDTIANTASNTDQLALDEKLEIKVIAAKGTSYEQVWETSVSSLSELNMLKLSPRQVDLLKTIIKEKWNYSVCFQELDQVVYGVFPNQDDKQLKKIFEALANLEYLFQDMKTLLIKSFPVISKEEDERTLLLVNNEIEETEEWVGINMNTIKKVPFLKALFSNQWKKDEKENLVKVSSVKAETIRLLDLYFSQLSESQMDLFETMPITSLPLSKFNLSPSQIMEDLDFLNVSFQNLPDDMYDINILAEKTKIKNDQEIAGWIVLAFDKFDEADVDPKLLLSKNRDHLFDRIMSILNAPQFYGKNLCQNLELACKKFHFTKNQKKNFEKVMQMAKSQNDFDEVELFDTLHTRDWFEERDKIYKEEREKNQKEWRSEFGMGFNSREFTRSRCPAVSDDKEECTCHYTERANEHGYIDEYNWDYECWGAFSAVFRLILWLKIHYVIENS